MKDQGAPGISFIIPVSQKMYVHRMANCLASIARQNHGQPWDFEYILVYTHKLGEEEPSESLKPLARLARLYNASLVFYSHDLPDYPLALARNVGARRSTRKYLAFVDADLVLDPQTVSCCMQAVPRAGPSAHCLVYRMPKYFEPASPIFRTKQTKHEFRENQTNGQLDVHGRGGFFYVSRELFFALRGYDEDFVGWGGEDDDLYQRIDNHLQEHPGRTIHLSGEYGIYAMHQWHEHKKDFKKLTKQNRKLLGTKTTIVRNDPGFWGGAPV